MSGIAFNESLILEFDKPMTGLECLVCHDRLSL